MTRSSPWLAAIAASLACGLALGSAAPAAALEQRLVAADGTPSDRLGDSVALDGDTIVVGAPFANVGANEFQGAVYVFARSGDAWTQVAKLTAADGAAGDRLGHSVALDGDTIVAGAPSINSPSRGAGAVYVFTHAGGTWTQTTKLTASDAAAQDWFGHSVGIDGDTLVAGAPQDDVAFGNQGSAYVFARTGDTWAQAARLTASDGLPSDFLGNSVAIDGDTIVAGAPFDDVGSGVQQGSAYTFVRSGTAWAQTARLTASDGTPDDWLGFSVAIDGDTIVAGAPAENTFRGSAYTFARTGGNRTQTAKLTASDGAAQDTFGDSVAIEGDRIVVGAPCDSGPNTCQGSAYTFARAGGNRTQTAKLIAFDARASDQLGQSVAIAGPTIVSGAPGDTVGTNAAQGSARVFFEPAAPSAVDDVYAVDEDATLDVPAPGVLANDDPQGQMLSAVLVTGPASGSLTLHADGSFTYKPDPDFDGADSFTYAAGDGSAVSTPATVTITVRAVNDAPAAAVDSFAVAEDAPLAVAAPGVLDNDTDVEGDPLTAVLVAAPAHGTLSLSPDGSFSYAPEPNFNGADGFTYRASDGAAASAPTTVAITVNAVNDAPVAAADGPYLGIVGEAVTLDGSASDDVEGAPLTYTWDFGDGSTLITTDPTPTHAYAAAGIYTITLVVHDGALESAPATTSATIGSPIGSGRGDVDAFLSYASPGDRTVRLPAGTTSIAVTILYGATIAPATFAAELDGSPFTGFTPAPGTSETVTIPLEPGRNVLVLSVDGTRADGKTATDRDRLTFVVD